MIWTKLPWMVETYFWAWCSTFQITLCKCNTEEHLQSCQREQENCPASPQYPLHPQENCPPENWARENRSHQFDIKTIISEWIWWSYIWIYVRAYTVNDREKLKCLCHEYPQRKIPIFHLIPWCRNFVETHSSHRVLSESRWSGRH